MYTSEIADFCKSNAILSCYFRGVIGIEQLPKVKKARNSSFYIVNVQKSSEVYHLAYMDELP